MVLHNSFVVGAESNRRLGHVLSQSAVRIDKQEISFCKSHFEVRMENVILGEESGMQEPWFRHTPPRHTRAWASHNEIIRMTKNGLTSDISVNIDKYKSFTRSIYVIARRGFRRN
jgi:hypothetical protein